MCNVTEVHVLEIDVLISYICGAVYGRRSKYRRVKNTQLWRLQIRKKNSTMLIPQNQYATSSLQGKSCKITFVDLVHSSCSRTPPRTWDLKLHALFVITVGSGIRTHCHFVLVQPYAYSHITPDMCRFIRWTFLEHRHIHDLNSDDHLLVPIFTICSAFLFFIR